jgi:transposase-like protein
MKAEVSVPEMVEMLKEIQTQPEKLFETIRVNIRETAGSYLSGLMDIDLTRFQGREQYEQGHGDVNHRNGSYGRSFTLQGIGEVQAKAPRDRKGEFSTQVTTKSLKKTVADELRSIFYASSKDKALEFLTEFKRRSERQLPSAVKCVQNSLQSSLTFFNFPEEEWISLRTTNSIERLNKEFRRRAKPMEIVAGENACYLLPAFVSIKMELHWRSNPVGNVPKNLPFFKRLDDKKCAQKT